MKSLAGNCSVLLLVACATATDKPLTATEAFAHQDPPAAVEKLPKPEVFAQSFRRVVECEEQARTFQARAPDAAWAYVKACAARGRFTLLPQLLEYWSADLKRPDAAVLLADAVAARGLLKADLVALQQRGLAYFDLASAIDRPQTYRGQTVLFFGQIRGSYENQEANTVEIDELDLMSVSGEAVESPRDTTQVSSQQSLSGSVRSPYFAGQGGGVMQRNETMMQGRTALRYETAIEKTGRDVIGHLPKNDPFLASQKPWLFVARFDDVWRPNGDDEEQRVPVVSIESCTS